jgi:hypothetical protein
VQVKKSDAPNPDVLRACEKTVAVFDQIARSCQRIMQSLRDTANHPMSAEAALATIRSFQEIEGRHAFDGLAAGLKTLSEHTARMARNERG